MAQSEVMSKRELLEEIDRLKAIIDSIGDAVSIQDLSFNILYQNRAHRDLIGDHAGKECYRAFHQKESVCGNCPVAGSFNDGLVHSTVTFTKTVRGPMYTEITASPLKNAKGEITAGIKVVRDITSRRQAEEELQFYRKIVSHMAEGVLLIRAGDGVIVYANSKFERMFGYGPGELEGKHVSVVNAPTDKSPEKTADEIIGALARDGVWTGEIRNIRKDGTPFWCSAVVSTFDHYAHGALWISVHQDITDRKRAEEEISKSNHMLDDITQGITESILLLSRDHKILWANKAAYEQTGLPKEELIGNYCYKATHHLEGPCEVPNDPCPVYELMKTGSPVLAEHTHYDRQGKELSVEVNVYPVKDETGEITRLVHVSRDISQRRNFEKEREKLITELKDALAEVRMLSGLLPICASCKKIRDDGGYWTQIETYISQHSDAKFTHGLCPECIRKLYPELYDDFTGEEEM